MIEKAQDLGSPTLGQVEGHPADAVVVEGQSCAAQLFEQIVDRLALAQGMGQRRGGADVRGHGTDGDEVVRNAAQLARDGADVLRARGRLDAQQALDGQRIAFVGEHRGQVVDAVGEGHIPWVGHHFADLFQPAVQVADVRHRAPNDLAVGLRDEIDDPVGGRVLRPKIDDDFLVALVGAAKDVPVKLHVDGHGYPFLSGAGTTGSVAVAVAVVVAVAVAGAASAAAAAAAAAIALRFSSVTLESCTSGSGRSLPMPW